MMPVPASDELSMAVLVVSKDYTSRKHTLDKQPACDPGKLDHMCHAYFHSSNSVVWC